MLCGDQKASCPLAPPGPGQPGGELSCHTPVSADADAGQACSAAGWAQVGVCGRRETSAVLTEAAVGVKCAAGRLGGTCGTQPGPCQAPRGPPCGPVVKCTCLRLPAGEEAQGGPQGAAPGPGAGSARGSVSWRWEPGARCRADRTGPAAAPVPAPAGAVPAGSLARPALSETADVDGERSFWSLGPARCLCAGEAAAAPHPKGFLAVGDTEAVAGTVAGTAALPGRGVWSDYKIHSSVQGSSRNRPQR